MAHPQAVDTIIVGGGQAGLALSHALTRHGHAHLVLEQAAQPANAWRNDRWDSFTLLTPNWSIALPDAEYAGADPDGFMPRDELVAYLERYAAPQPVRYGVRVTSVEPRADERAHLVSCDVGGQAETYEARHVVIATGLFQRPKVSAFASALPPDIMQLTSGAYRRPDELPSGATLVIGAAQSGGQIVEELYQAGRKVYLCVGFAPRAPRRYRGKDIYRWTALSGFLDRTADQLPSPRMRFAPNPLLSGKNGGHSLNLRQFARDGVTLLGRARGAQGHTLALQPGLNATLARMDAAEAELCGMVDTFIERTGLDAPAEELAQVESGEIEELTDLDLRAAGISSIIWAMGYSFDFGLARAPIFDADGYPMQQCGVTSVRGLYFLGLPWLTKMRSGLLYGVGEDALGLAETIAGSR